MSEPTFFRVSREGHVAWVVLNRPEKRNAMTMEFFIELSDIFQTLDQETEVRVVVLKAEGPSFSAGLDLMALAGLVESHAADARENLRRTIIQAQESINAVEDCRQPVIAAVHGHCIGGGLDLICACDVRLAARDAVFSVRETRLALVADLGTLQRLPSLVGQGWAQELALTGRDFSAEEALEIGLLTHVRPDKEALFVQAGELAREIAANSPLAVQGVKDIMRFTRNHGPEAGLKYVAQKNAAILMCDDSLEAVAAFLEKRPPDFKGR